MVSQQRALLLHPAVLCMMACNEVYLLKYSTIFNLYVLEDFFLLHPVINKTAFYTKTNRIEDD